MVIARDAPCPDALAALVVLLQISYPLTAGRPRELLTIATVGVFFLATVSHALRHRGAGWTAAYVAVTAGTGLLAEAQQEVLLVGYAVQAGAGVTDALAAVAARDVAITLLLEREQDNPAFSQPGDPFGDVPAVRLAWPSAQREAHSSLHAKVLVVDRRVALVGSANLTGAAMERNLECGLLLRGGPVPANICRHVESLVETGLLHRLE